MQHLCTSTCATSWKESAVCMAACAPWHCMTVIRGRGCSSHNRYSGHWSHKQCPTYVSYGLGQSTPCLWEGHRGVVVCEFCMLKAKQFVHQSVPTYVSLVLYKLKFCSPHIGWSQNRIGAKHSGFYMQRLSSTTFAINLAEGSRLKG